MVSLLAGVSMRSANVWGMRNILLIVALAFAALSPAVAQTASPAPSPSASPSLSEFARGRVDAMLSTGHAHAEWFSRVVSRAGDGAPDRCDHLAAQDGARRLQEYRRYAGRLHGALRKRHRRSARAPRCRQQDRRPAIQSSENTSGVARRRAAERFDPNRECCPT